MKIEGIELTQTMLDHIKWLQNNPQVMTDHLEKFDQAIAFIAHENESEDQATARKALQLISLLFYIKGIYKSLDGKE